MDNITIVFAMMMVFLGILLFTHSSNIERNAKNDKVRTNNRKITVLSVLLIVLPITLFVCNRTCKNVGMLSLSY